MRKNGLNLEIFSFSLESCVTKGKCVTRGMATVVNMYCPLEYSPEIESFVRPLKNCYLYVIKYSYIIM